MVDSALDKHLIPDLASIVLEYCQLERVDKVMFSTRFVYTTLFGELHGESKRYYPTGKLWYSEHYVNDMRHGEFKCYYPTSELWYSEHYVNDMRHGESKFYYQTGKLYRSSRWINGKQL